MNTHARHAGGRTARRSRASAFTLVELLTVIAIISLLISILVPSVSRARDAAKNAKTRAIMKSMADGLEMFVGENAAELRGRNYPSSAAGDDPTEAGNNATPLTNLGQLMSVDMSGAQWAVRYLMGKRIDGYVPRRVVPPDRISTTPGEEQLSWYDANDPLPRSGPYLDAGAVKLKSPKELVGGPGGTPVAADDLTPRFNNPVIVDSFEMPIVYYSANSLQAAKANASIACYNPVDDPNTPGIYMYSDNALFTGLCLEGGTCLVPRWNFGGGDHPLTYGPAAWVGQPDLLRQQIGSYPHSFAYYILNKGAWESSNTDPAKRSVVPSRRDSFILFSPGKDGLFGTGDDVTNF
jgi:prepilin-type N-terminal cleavage/methylation domain-containing protein